MLIGVSGPVASGKTEIARYLTFQGFLFISTLADFSSDLSLAPSHTFANIEELIAHVTKYYDHNFVMTNILHQKDLDKLQIRPFFLHIAVDAPLAVRFQRQRSSLSFEEFSAASDELLYSSLHAVVHSASLVVLNTKTSLSDLYNQLSSLNLLDPTRLRPTWDAYFMSLADLAALRSNCMKRRVGCVIVKNHRVMATGYNGTPRGLTNCNEGGCPRCNSGTSGLLATCLCLHAEENALLESGKERLGSGNGTDGVVLYCNTCPCLTCSIKIVQCGVKEVVYSQSYNMDEQSAEVLRQGGVTLRQFSPPKEGVFV
ncbi:hypothetical protein BABINDRAFT_173074 [Babjeviella inositovora NRRL Y-12698]|uniref:Deoxycytidylate deaminase n=1 Tax=Babjeviella inositovora NRRL Y-12698 TaxID=984486 RepID=A0A1E3QGV3_9ASCO|nr:uncharacterized protein BABINDRAFT_173074 [Babjeviella inositovora NRRL Y-12698]ODQ76925.1 hypothetical protein BABINDRAFT_173074 [Babjeviella inositovora NRRL Y-12698]